MPIDEQQAPGGGRGGGGSAGLSLGGHAASLGWSTDSPASAGLASPDRRAP
ncbi:hypothetical protein UO65_4770 [Actinokineospora spheciospongiae]|uniref:Uncharacterized protein n=1 Tax=Actinokineospora spheciospongiae TaxID=909613 RepID=W7IG86_9PSEU|nr:hypothetical protein UO65_4770 [Actinokineospora spheciospongiae]